MQTIPLQTLINLLLEALDDPHHRYQTLLDFEKMVQISGEPLASEAWVWNEILKELAYDIAYYEPDPLKRADDSVLIGDEEIITEINSALNKLKERGVRIPNRN